MIIAFDARTGQIATIDGSPGTPSPPAVVWTSHLYPLEVIESLSAGALLQRGRVFWQPMDGLNVGATLQAGALTRVIGYQTSNAPSEAIDVGATLQAAALTVVIRYQTYNAAPDSVDVSAALKAGSLIRVIGYVDTSANEALDVSATIVGGTLS